MDQSRPGQKLGDPEWDELEYGERRLDALGVVEQAKVLLYCLDLFWKLNQHFQVRGRSNRWNLGCVIPHTDWLYA